MAKTKGGVRPVSRRTTTYQNRWADYQSLMQSDKYSDGFFSEKGGGFYVVENSTFKHKPEEMEAATHLADSGYKVYLTSETGHIKTKEGDVFSYSYEQSTPKDAKGGHGVKKCLGHAKSKGVDVAVIYDKHQRFSSKNISAGIQEFEKYNKKYRFKRIIVIDHNGKVHTHKHES